MAMSASMAPIAFELDITSVLTLAMGPVIIIFLYSDAFSDQVKAKAKLY